MSVEDAIQAAERLLPGRTAAEGHTDPRWQAIITVGAFIENAPGPVWEFTKRWGVHPDDDLRTAIATCLVEHLLESHFEAFFPRVEQLVRVNRFFAGTFGKCWKFGQSDVPANAARFDALKREASNLAG